MLTQRLKRYRYPVEIISFAVWSYHHFNDSYRDIKERLLYRGISVSHETARTWCNKFGSHFKDVIKKREPSLQINGQERAYRPSESFIACNKQ